jgi:tetratricopeptide (TPR) repeat protein
MTRAASPIAQLDDPSESVIASLSAELSADRALTGSLRNCVTANETLKIAAGASSPKPGIVALTTNRLLFLYSEGRLRRAVMCSAFARDDLRGCRADAEGLLVLRFKQPAVRLTAFAPAHACDELAAAIGIPPIDRWAAALGNVTPRLRDTLDMHIPPNETVVTVTQSLDPHSGLLALTNASFVWIWLSPSDTRPDVAATWPRDKSAWEALREVPRELQEALCVLHEIREEWDELLAVSGRSWFTAADLFKANALAHKGLNDAAIVVYDDAIRAGKKSGIRLQHLARYRKAALLIDMGDLTRARRDLARLYADDPTFDDQAHLLDRVGTATSRRGRQPIPEDVRHAVWRRDEGRCVECGSQENIEFDHVIPFARGGSNTERNLQLLCEPCNRRKSAAI